MSASIYYRPFDGEVCITPQAPSMFIEMLKEVFGDLPRTFTREDERFLYAMSVGCTDTSIKSALDKLREGVEKHDDVEVYARY